MCLSVGGNGVKQRTVDGPRHQHMRRLFPSFSETPATELAPYSALIHPTGQMTLVLQGELPVCSFWIHFILDVKCTFLAIFLPDEHCGFSKIEI